MPDETPEVEAYHHLSAYTLTLGDIEFSHQHVVDAWAVQHATPSSKTIGVFFGLAGLYLHLERGFNGREVQRAHMTMARTRYTWPALSLPIERGEITAIDVIQTPEGAERATAIDRWCASVWKAFEEHHPEVRRIVDEKLRQPA
jgi:hypothetical protein